MLSSIANSPIKGVAILASSTPARASDFTGGVRAAIKAYAKTGQMQDAALAYAEHGIPVFPVSAVNKNPIAPKLIDEQGKPIDGSGGLKRATCDPEQICQWWPRSQYKKRRPIMIGVPMGPLSGVWCLDIDVKSGGHANDGMAPWKALQDEHGAIKTRQHVTASGGLHEIFRWNDLHPITSRRGNIPRGIDIKGVGGYIVVPPSKRNGNDYAVTINAAPKEAPAWLYDLIGKAPAVRTIIHRDPAKPLNVYQQWLLESRAENRNKGALADIAELREAMQFVPNDDDDWDAWTAIGMALELATRHDVGEGFKLFDGYSQKSAKYNSKRTEDRWREIQRSPGNRIGAGKLFKIAMSNGWKTAPTHAPSDFTELKKARADIALHVDRFLNRNIWQLLGDLYCGAAVHALRVSTGVGKTAIAIAALTNSDKSFHYVVPTLKLADEIAERFRALGVNVRVARGRSADDPDSPGDLMCLEPDKVAIAVRQKLDVSKACCKIGNEACPVLDQCGYQQQWRDTDNVRGWIFAADFLFHRQDALGTPDVVVIDENFWQKQLRGLENDHISLPLRFSGDLKVISEALKRQPDDGGLQFKYAQYAGDVRSLNDLIKAQWDEMPEVEMHPSMNARQLKAHLKKHSMTLKAIAYQHVVITVLEELRDMVLHEIPVSGRLKLVTVDGERVIERRGVSTIKKQFQRPTLIFDATLPSDDILRVSHPRARLAADIEVALPDCVTVRQITGTPTSTTKLINGEAIEKHREDIRRYVLRRFIEIGRKSTLVIVQKQVESFLRDSLPKEITVVHFGAVAGLDTFGNVRLLIAIGRVQPGPEVTEVIAGALSGAMPMLVGNDEDEDDGFRWYERTRRGIRCKDGSGVAVIGDRHPDELCEAIRQQICEAELMQAIGRARGVNRTADTPLDIDLLFDVVLPIAVDDVDLWQKQSLFISTAIDGVMITSKTDLMKIWPQIFSDKNVADRTIAKGVPTLQGFEIVRYRPAGPKMKWRTAHFDRAVIPDPATWLAERLGPVQVDPCR